MNLFSVKNNTTKKVLIRHSDIYPSGSPAFFLTKRDAKSFRDEMNRQEGISFCHVSKGPDHRHYSGSEK